MLEIRKIEDKTEWEDFLATHPETSFLQSWYWGEFHQKLGNGIKRTGFYKDGRLAGVILCITEEAKRARYLTVPGGPIIDWSNKEAIQAFSNEVIKIAREEECVFVRVRPQLENNEFAKRIFAS